MTQLHVFAGGVATETNVFSPLPTGLYDYDIARPDGGAATYDMIAGPSLSRFAERAEAECCRFTRGLYACASPAGITTRAAYEQLRDELLAGLETAHPVDCILLSLHGAMVADGYGDCETDLVARARALAPDATIGVLLDPHCDLPDELVQAVDAIVAYKEYPHVDVGDRADDLARIVIAAARGEVEPVMATFDCRMVGMYPTSREPMRSFVDGLYEAERREGILSVSLGHGFPWGDAPALGSRMLVVADGDTVAARSLAEELGRGFFALRHEVDLEPLSLDAALDRALSSSARPVVIADTSDNPGGGAPSDATFVLEELLRRGVEEAALALFWDPVAVQLAFAAGKGATLKLRLGGKMGPTSGSPLDLTVTVAGLAADLVQRWPQTNGFIEMSCGPSARLTCGGIDVIVGSVRRQVVGLEVFSAFGIEPTERKLLVVKSTNHFHAAYGPIASDVIYASAPGTLIPTPQKLPYRHVDTRKYPWIDEPFA